MPARYLLRLGMGEAELETELDFSRVGRVNALLARRLELLAEVGAAPLPLLLAEGPGRWRGAGRRGGDRWGGDRWGGDGRTEVAGSEAAGLW